MESAGGGVRAGSSPPKSLVRSGMRTGGVTANLEVEVGEEKMEGRGESGMGGSKDQEALVPVPVPVPIGVVILVGWLAKRAREASCEDDASDKSN